MTCETCGTETGELAPCPCGLVIECPVRFGVCADCWRVIARNAANRRRELSTGFPSSYVQPASGRVPA